MAYQKIHFEDNGQDFLTWTVNSKGHVVDCRPFQFHVWKNVTVDVKTLQPGFCIYYKIKDDKREYALKHLTEKVVTVGRDDSDRPVRCTSCKKVHPVDMRVDKPSKAQEGMFDSVCPLCGGRGFYEVVS